MDADGLIEREAHDSIAHIFKSGGEGAFRALEAQTIEANRADDARRRRHRRRAVLSSSNRDAMKRDGFIVCLDAKPETIAKRVLESGAHVSDGPFSPATTRWPASASSRPSARRCTAQADLVVETDELTPDEVTHQILLAYRERTQAPSPA